MQVMVAISLGEGETIGYTPEEAAQVIIDALDDVHSDKDFCSVTITTSQQGGVGFVPPPTPVPPLETNGPPPA
jgi:hypothetical protein